MMKEGVLPVDARRVSLDDAHARDAAVFSHARSCKPTCTPPARRTFRVKVWCVPRFSTSVEDPMFVHTFLGFVVAPGEQFAGATAAARRTTRARAIEHPFLEPSGTAVSHREDGSWGNTSLTTPVISPLDVFLPNRRTAEFRQAVAPQGSCTPKAPLRRSKRRAAACGNFRLRAQTARGVCFSSRGCARRECSLARRVKRYRASSWSALTSVPLMA